MPRNKSAAHQGGKYNSHVSNSISCSQKSNINKSVSSEQIDIIPNFSNIMAGNTQNQKVVPKKFKWTLDYTQKQRSGEICNPPGFNSSVTHHYSDVTRDVDPNLIVKRSWDFALGPIKQVPMNLFLMYMAGNSISIFPIMMVGMLFMRPIKALVSISSAFKMIEGSHHIVQKLAYCFGNFVNLGVALYKCQSMGLLPTHTSDWLAFVQPQERMEFYGGGISLT